MYVYPRDTNPTKHYCQLYLISVLRTLVMDTSTRCTIRSTSFSILPCYHPRVPSSSTTYV